MFLFKIDQIRILANRFQEPFKIIKDLQRYNIFFLREKQIVTKRKEKQKNNPSIRINL